MQFSKRELATILVALRLYQEADAPMAPALYDIATDCGAFPPMTPGQIDGLCEKLNGAQA